MTMRHKIYSFYDYMDGLVERKWNSAKTSLVQI